MCLLHQTLVNSFRTWRLCVFACRFAGIFPPTADTPTRNSIPGVVGAVSVTLPHYPPLACFDELHQIIYLGRSRQPVPSQLFQSLLGV
jgi:hypothetical protein